MKKKYLLLLALFLLKGQILPAQTWKEWFSQKRTQKAYLLQQIAALKMYAGVAWKGYQIAGEGLQVIDGIKRDGYRLHQDFFESLKGPSFAVRQDPLTSRAAAAYVKTQAAIHIYVDRLEQSAHLEPNKLEYVRRVYARLKREGELAIAELNALLSDHRLLLDDQQRLKRMALLYHSLRRQEEFCYAFGKQALAFSELKGGQKRNENFQKWFFKIP